MGVYLGLTNFADVFRKSPIEPIILNDLASATKEDKRIVDRLTSVRYESDLLSNEPSCECGKITGGYNLGVLCSDCRTPVRDIFEQQLMPLVWIRSPAGVAKLINPMVLNQLSHKFTKTGFNIIEWICNTNYQPPGGRPDEVDELVLLGVERGYNNFIEHFDEYLDLLFSLKSFKSKKEEIDPLHRLIREQRESVLSDYLPLPNRSILVVENTQVGIYVDPIIIGAVDAIRTMCSIDTALVSYTVRQKENRTAKALFTFAAFYNSVYHDILASKNGIFRKHIYGTRNNFSLRAVISSNTRAHEYDELHIPWAGGVTMLKTHLMNKLLKLNYTPNEATGFLQECTYRYDPLIDRLFQELIVESNGGLVTTFNRNPSLTRASCQRMRITKVKTDPNDPTISMSILAVKGFNADFDGDQMNAFLANDQFMSKEMENLAPHKNMIDVNSPRSLSKVAAMPKPAVSTIANWLSYPRTLSHDPSKEQFLKELAN